MSASYGLPHLAYFMLVSIMLNSVEFWEICHQLLLPHWPAAIVAHIANFNTVVQLGISNFLSCFHCHKPATYSSESSPLSNVFLGHDFPHMRHYHHLPANTTIYNLPPFGSGMQLRFFLNAAIVVVSVMDSIVRTHACSPECFHSYFVFRLSSSISR
mgnify:FL=1